MTSRFGLAFVAVTAVLCGVTATWANPIPGIANTGAGGVTPGNPDLNYSGGIVVNANSTGDQWLGGGVGSLPAGAQWISQHQVGGNVVDAFPFTGPPSSTTYTYNLNFSLAGLDPTSAVINYQFAVDNALEVKLNGVSKQIFDIGINPSTFQTLHAGVVINSGFNAGANTLSFVLTNFTSVFNPEGLLVTITGTANPLTDIPGPVPEPASMLLWALVGGGAAFAGWRRSRSAS